MELNHLRYFHEVASAGGFTQAARKLNISQSALSKAVALLEEREGIQLLERTKKGVVLTEIGADFFRKSSSIFQMVDELELMAQGKKEVCEGPLRFGASDHLTNYFLIPKLRRIRKEHPSVLPSVFSGAPNEILSQIFSQTLEFGLFFTKVNAPGISYEAISSFPMAVVCHPRLLRGKKMTKGTLREVIETHGFIGSIQSQYRVHPAQDVLKLANLKPTFSFESNSQETQKRFCLEGGGIAYLARFMVEDEIASGELVEVSTAKPLKLELWLAQKQGHTLSLNARTFLETLKF